MEISVFDNFEIIGIIAFAISGTMVGIKRKMDIFGVNVLAITTAFGGGLMRDLILGKTPPTVFQNAVLVTLAALLANIIFTLIYFNKLHINLNKTYDALLFWFDTFGLAAFVVDGTMIAVDAGFQENMFLVVFTGFMSGVGGGALRDILANQMPDIFIKRIYAVAAITGSLFMMLLYRLLHSWQAAMLGGFIIVIILRFLAAHFKWNLPKINPTQ